MNKLILIFLIFISFQIYGQERIISYDVELDIKADASMEVTEAIKVNAQGDQIRRGIYRQIPLFFKNPDGRSVYLDIEVLSLSRNGKDEHFDAFKSGGGIRIDFGDDSFLDHGDHQYVFKYIVKDAIGYFDDLDEIYWNATGNEWAFNIESASVTVKVPEGAKIEQTSAYTGRDGENGEDYTVQVDENVVTFKTTKNLPSRAGITVGAGFTKGFLAAPTKQDRFSTALSRQQAYIVTFVLLIILFLYFYFTWKKVGVDPKRGTIIPHFDPPKGYSPGECRYIYRHFSDDKVLIADLIDLGVKGLIGIENSGKTFSLRFLKDAEEEEISASQAVILSNLKGKGGKVMLKQSNRTFLSKLKSTHAAKIKEKLGKAYFNLNGKWSFYGFLILAVAIIYLLFYAPMITYESELRFFAAFILIFSIAGFSTFFHALIDFLDGKNKIGSVIGSFIFMLFSLIFWAVFVNFIYLDFLMVLVLPVVGIIIFSIFSKLLGAPTEKGQVMIDYLDGLKLFMKKAEQYRFDALQDPEKGLQLFEELLPYAIAMNVENSWGKSFDSIVQKALQVESTRSRSHLYSSGGAALSASALAKSMSSSFSSSLQSATASSSGGSGGGGSSGGGGGGGGGGGR